MPHALIIEGWLAQLLGLLLIATLLSARPPSTGNRLLAVALLCAVYRQFLITAQLSRAIGVSPLLFHTAFPFQMLAIPMFYLYVRALTTPGFTLDRKHAVHLIPFAGGVAWYLGMWTWGDPSVDRGLYIRVVVKVLVSIPYLIGAHRQVRAFARQSKNHLSDLTPLKLNWLRALLIVVYSMTGVDALDIVTGPEIHVWRLVPLAGLISLMALAYFSLRVSPVFTRVSEYQKADSVVDNLAGLEQKKGPGHLSDEQLDRQKERLIEMLESQALYLKPELRLSDLAAALDIRPYRVSEILGRGLQTSFYDLINRYRTTHAQKLLSSPDSAYMNLLGIALDSGFRSKSVFNEAFKKATGITPSEFRTRKTTESLHSDG